jgi:hypothetical protein
MTPYDIEAIFIYSMVAAFFISVLAYIYKELKKEKE